MSTECGSNVALVPLSGARRLVSSQRKILCCDDDQAGGASLHQATKGARYGRTSCATGRPQCMAPRNCFLVVKKRWVLMREIADPLSRRCRVNSAQRRLGEICRNGLAMVIMCSGRFASDADGEYAAIAGAMFVCIRLEKGPPSKYSRAEGVEMEHQAKTLRNLQCDDVHGCSISQSLRPGDIEACPCNRSNAAPPKAPSVASAAYPVPCRAARLLQPQVTA
jgi:hypothetical protein